MRTQTWLAFVLFFILILMPACSSSDDDPAPDGDIDGDMEASPDGDESPDGDVDADGDTEMDESLYPRQEGLTPPPKPADELGYTLPARTSEETLPTQEEITAFTKKITAFFKDTGYFDWVWRTAHGLDASYDTNMMDYKLWWQDTGMRKNGDTIEFFHTGRAENIAKRTIKVLNNSLAGYLLTGDTRMAEVAVQLMRGMVALSLGMEFESEEPLVKYLQSRAVFNHNHDYEVDGRKVHVDYEGMYVASFKWNVHVFEIEDNPTYGDIWISNMRSKDDVPYMFYSLAIATRAYHEAQDPAVREAAELFIEYMRGFAQSIVDNDWFILTKYEDGEATIAIDATMENNPPADLGSFVHWKSIFGPDAECNAQLGAAMAGYGFPADRGDCEGGKIGWNFELNAERTHYFNYNIYNYFHVAALATSQLWGFDEIAKSINEGLIYRFEELMHNPDMPNTDDREFPSDLAGVMLTAATHGYPLNAEEAKFIMDWYSRSSDWYRQWPHWDPWASLADQEEFSDYKAPRVETVSDGNGNETQISYMRLVEMPYIFEYCYSPLKNPDAVPFIDCDIVADPNKWGEDEKK